jgi:hypothetical protein
MPKASERIAPVQAPERWTWNPTRVRCVLLVPGAAMTGGRVVRREL